MNTAFELATEKTGREYLELELDLRRRSQLDVNESEDLRRASHSHPDPVGRLVAKVVLEWAGPREKDFKAVLFYLERLPIKVARTAKAKPSPSGVESYLTLHFADRVAEFLALRLAKQEEWPQWQVDAVILYLREHKVLSTTSVLIRFAIAQTDADWRAFALESIRAISDPEVGAKLAFEIARAKQLGLTVPTDVKMLGA